MTRKRRTVLSEPATEPHGALSFELLEPRVMFSAGPLGVADLFIASDGDDAHEDETALIAPWEAEPAGYPSPLLTGAVDEPFQALAKETHSPLELVFIDASLADSALLAQQIEALNPHAQIQTYFIDTQVDGVAEITSVLSGYQGVQAVHLFSHAGDGALQLGNTLLDEAGLTGYAEQIANWQRALVADGDLLLYGCNLAASDIGVSFVDSLVTLSGLDVAASTDLTGNTTTGGNWQLEHQNGDITYTLNVAQNAWQGTLAIYNVTIFDDIIDSGDGELSLREAVIAANGDAVKDTIVLAAGTYNLTILLALGEEYQQDLDIKESLIIIGAGADQTFINAGNNFGVFQFKSQALDNEIQGITIQNGDVAGSGGAIAMEKSSGTLLLKDVEITGSSASSNGGAIYNVGNLVMERVTLAGNSASSGGGLYNDTGATASLTNVTISGNSVTGDGGGAFNLGTLNLTNVTVAKNHAGNMGGGLFQSSSGATSLTNTVVSNNTAGTSAVDVSGAFSSDGSNFIADQTGSTGFGSDQSGDPRLDVLANYGGQTRTHAMLTASPLVDAGTNTGAPTEDQRGQTRVGIADIGAYEFIPNQAPTLTATSLNPTYTEGAGAAVVFSGADANTVEAGQTFSAVTLTITNITDGSAEVLNISSIAIALTHLNSGTVAGFNYSVTLAGSTATLSLTGGSANSTAMNALINSISYQNNSQDPTAATRRLTITSLQDNGGTEGSGADTASPDLVSDITVQPVNNAPNLVNNTLTVTQGGVVVLGSTMLGATDADHADAGLVFTVTNQTQGFFALTSDISTAVSSFTQAQVSASEVVFVHDGGELKPSYRVSVSDGVDATLPSAATINFTGTAEGVLWLSTEGNEGSGNGIPGLDGGAISKGDILQQAGPSFTLGAGNTNGTFSVAFDISNFSSGDGIQGIHYVTSSVTLGATNAITLRAGDIILSTKDAMTLTSNGVGAPANLNMANDELVFFRPDSAGDYSTGNFYRLLSDPFNDGAEIRGISLVEKDTWVADYQLKQGDLLLSRSGGSEDNDIWLLRTEALDTQNALSYPAALKLIEGDDEKINISKKITGIELLENDQTIGGVAYDAGTLFVTLDDDNNQTGRNDLDVKKEDIAALELTKTTLGSGNANAKVSILFDGSNVGFNSGNETLDALSFTFDLDSSDNPPVLSANSFALFEGQTTVITPAFLAATDSDSADSGLVFNITALAGGVFELTTNPGVAVTSFTQGQVNNSEVIFVDDGDDTSPAFSISVSDGTSSTTPVAAVINFTGVNDAPTLSLNSTTPTFTEGGAAVAVYNSANASTVESGQRFSGLSLQISNLSDGSAEQLLLDGSTLALTSGTGSTATNGLSYTIALTGSTATLTLSGGTLSASELNTLLNTLSYQNSSDDPTAGNRLITLSSISDNGGTANGGNDTVAPDITSTVTVQPVNDAPTLVLNSTTSTFSEGGAAVAVYNSANASTVESGQRFSGLSLQISNLSDGSAEQLLLDGSTLALTSGTGSTATNGLSYTIALTGSTATLTVTGGTLNASELNTLLNTLSYQNSSDDPTAGNRLITLSSISDNGGTANGGNDTVAPDITSTVTVQPVNDAPTLILNSTTPTFTEGRAAVAVYNSANASTVESGQRFSGLSLQISNLSDGSAEQLLLDGSTLALTSGTGSTATNGLSYTIALTGSTATLTVTGGTLSASELNTLLNTLSYQNSSDDPTAGNRLITLSSVSDNGGTANGGNDTVAPDITSTVTVQPVNDAPTLILNSTTPTFSEGGAAVAVYNSANASTVESGQRFSGLSLQISNLSDGSAEQLLLDGSTLALTSGTGSTATNGLSYSIVVSGSSATLTVSGASLTAAELNTLLNTLSYQNSSDDPTAGNRLITLSSVSDNGGTANGGNDTVAPDITSTVTVQPVNDAPTLILNSTTPTFSEGGAAVAVYNSANASTVESGQRFSGLSLQISNLSDGSAEQLLLDGSTLALTSGTGSTATNGLSYTIALTGSIATLTINGASLTAVQLETLLNTLSYQNSSDDPTAGNRLITLSSISDNGGTANGGNDTVAPDITSTVTVQPVNDAPLISVAGFTVNQGGKTTLTPLQFSFSDADHADTALEFVITSVSGGYFENATAPGVSVTRFTFNELFAGQVRFVDDNTPNTPAFSIQVSDGVASSAVLAGAVNFVPTPVVAGSGNAQAPAIVSDVVSPTEETSAVPKETPKEEASQPAPAAPVTVVSTVPSQDSTLGVQLAHKQPGDNDTPAMTVAETLIEEVEQKHITLAVAEVLSDQSGRVLSWTQMSDPLMLIKSSNFMDSLNKLDRDVQNNVTLDTVLAGTGAALSTGLSIGYVAWLLRSGIILTSVLTSLPAWRFIDPLPVLSRLGGEDTDEESLEDMVSKDNDEQSVNKA